MKLRTLYACSPAGDSPMPTVNTTVADFCEQVRASNEYPIYGCHFGQTMVTKFELSSKEQGYLFIHEKSAVDNIMIDDVYIPTDSERTLDGIVENFAIGGVDDYGFEHYVVRYPTKTATRYELTIEEYLLLMVTYALAYTNEHYSFSTVFSAIELIAKDGVIGVYNEQELVNKCDMHKIMNILNTVDFDYERKHPLSTRINVPECADERMILARAYAANTFLEKGAIK